MVASYSGAFGEGGWPFSQFLRKTAITEFTVISFKFFIRVSKFDVSNLPLSSMFRALQDDGCLCVSE